MLSPCCVLIKSCRRYRLALQHFKVILVFKKDLETVIVIFSGGILPQ